MAAALAGVVVWGAGAAGDPGRPGDVRALERLTLRDAVARFRRAGFDLLVADAAIEGATGDLATATAVANPSVEGGVSYSFFRDGLYETHGGWQVGIGDSNALADALSGKRGLRARVARAALGAAQMRRQDVQRGVEMQLKEQFAATAAATALLQVSREVRDSAARTLGLNQIRFQRGAISEVDLAKTETAELEADQAVDAAVQALAQAKASLAFLMGQRRPELEFDVDPAEIGFRTPAALEHATRASLLEAALESRPDLLALRQEQQRAGNGAALARRLRFPDLGLGLQYQEAGSAAGAPSGASAITPPTVLLTLAGTLPVFYQQQGEIRRADADVATQNALAAKTQAQVVTDVQAAFAGYQATGALVTRMQGRLLERARRARDLTSVQYEKGAASLLEYLDAQRTYSAVNAEYWQDLASYWDAVFQLEAAVGMELSS